MKKIILIILAFLLTLFIGFIGGYFVNAFVKSNKYYDEEKLLSKLYLYVQLIKDENFSYIVKRNNKLFLTTEKTLSALADDNLLNIDNKKIRTIELSDGAVKSTEGASFIYICKDGHNIFFILDQAIVDEEFGVFYCEDNIGLNLQSYVPREIRRLVNYRGKGYWYYFSSM